MESFLDERDVVCYHPIKPCSSSSPRSVQLTSPSFVNVSYHDLQLLHHGSTAIRCDVSTPTSALCHLRLEADNATLTWTPPNWCPTQAAAPGVTPLDGLPSFDDDVSCVSVRELASRCHGKVLIADDFEEGFVSLNAVNEVLVTSCTGERASVARKFNLCGDASSEAVCISLFCGTSLTENKCLDFVLPARSAALWGASLRRLQACCWIQKHRVADRRLLWLKKQYLSLCSDEAGKRRSPTVAEAVAVRARFFLCFRTLFHHFSYLFSFFVQVFGGRKLMTSTNSLSANVSDSGANKTLAKQKSQKSSQVTSSGKGVARSSQEASLLLESCSTPCTNNCSAAGATRGGRGRADRPSAHADDVRAVQAGNASKKTFKGMSSLSSAGSAVFHPSKLTFRFLESDFLSVSEQRRLSMGALRASPSSEHLSSERPRSLVHSTAVELVDFIDLFKAFVLRSRKDLAQLFHRLAVAESSATVTSLQDDSPASSFPAHSCKADTARFLSRVGCHPVLSRCSVFNAQLRRRRFTEARKSQTL